MIELIVVVTIMALLTVIAIVSYSAAGKKSRDSKRASDLEKIRVALELYRQEKGSYPDEVDLLSPDYLQEWPQDPKNYSYFYSLATPYSYAVYGQMEDLGSTNGTYGDNCTGTCNYKLVNP